MSFDDMPILELQGPSDLMNGFETRNAKMMEQKMAKIVENKTQKPAGDLKYMPTKPPKRHTFLLPVKVIRRPGLPVVGNPGIYKKQLRLKVSNKSDYDGSINKAEKSKPNDAAQFADMYSKYCGLCKIFLHSDKAHEHHMLKKHLKYLQYKCAVCTAKFHTREEGIQHMKNEHLVRRNNQMHRLYDHVKENMKNQFLPEGQKMNESGERLAETSIRYNTVKNIEEKAVKETREVVETEPESANHSISCEDLLLEDDNNYMTYCNPINDIFVGAVNSENNQDKDELSLFQLNSSPVDNTEKDMFDLDEDFHVPRVDNDFDISFGF